MKQHPRADPKNHWVEHDPSQPKPKTKHPELYKVPESIGKKNDRIDMTKSLLRSSEPDKDGNYKWYDNKGKEVKGEQVWRANRLALELSVTNPDLKSVRVFTDYRPGSKKPFAMTYSNKWETRKSANPFKYYYTEIQNKEGNKKIMEKNFKFSKAFTAHFGDITKEADEGVPEAVILHLINLHIRIGTKGMKNDGICTMKAKYCTVDGNSIVIKDMPVKSDKKYSATITDPILVREFKKRLKGKKGDDFVFEVNDKKVNEYLKRKLGDKTFSTKNLRTCEATGIAFDIVTARATITNPDSSWKVREMSLDERYAIMAEACKAASESLNNTPDVCHSNYIDGRVFNVLALPDDAYHKSNPIEGVKADGTLIFKWQAKIDKIEDKLRRKCDDDQHSVWDKYLEARNEFLKRLNTDRRKDGWKDDLERLPEQHATKLLTQFLKRFET